MSLTEQAAAAKAKMEKSNPSVAPGKTKGERKRIPLSVPQRKLEAPDIPGYHLRWIRGTPQRIQQAERAGFEFVEQDEVELNNLSLGGDATRTGNSDMGSRVSVTEGGAGDDGQALRMYLMKQKMEYYLEDSEIVQKRNDGIADTLTAGYRQGTIGAGAASGETAEDVQQRYVDKSRSKVPELFRRKSSR